MNNKNGLNNANLENLLSQDIPAFANESTFDSLHQNNNQRDLFSNNQGAASSEHLSSSATSHAQMLKEIADLKEKNRVMTQKFQSCKKERDQLKKENTELQEQVSSLQNQMRSMVQCPNNSSQNFPMFNELTNKVGEFYKCDCQDVFFDILSTELNLEGVVYFYQNSLPPVIEQIEKYFWPMEHSIRQVTCSNRLDLSISNVLRKKYQSNWKEILTQVINKSFCESLMRKIQGVLAIADNESEDVNQQIVDFIKKFGEVALQMMVSDPPLLFNIDEIGKKVSYNQHKQESLDGFIKTNEDCYVILPSVYKMNSSNADSSQSSNSVQKNKGNKQINSTSASDAQINSKASSEPDYSMTSIIGNTKHIEQIKELDKDNGKSTSQLSLVSAADHNPFEKIIKMNVLPLNYEFS